MVVRGLKFMTCPLSLWPVVLRKKLVKSTTLLCTRCSLGTWSANLPTWRQRLVWNVLCVTVVLRLLPAVVTSWTLIGTLWSLFMGWTCCLRRVWSSRIRALQARPLILLKKSALLPVVLKVFAPLFMVFANEFPMRLKNLEVVSLCGMVL